MRVAKMVGAMLRASRAGLTPLEAARAGLAPLEVARAADLVPLIRRTMWDGRRWRDSRWKPSRLGVGR